MTDPAVVGRGALWTGRAPSGLVTAFLVLDAAIKLVPLPVVGETLEAVGVPAGPARGLGALTLACALLYAPPRPAVLGAILLAGLLGGAMATHLRVGSPVFAHLLFGLHPGLLAWGGPYLRDPRLRALVPMRVPRAGRPCRAGAPPVSRPLARAPLVRAAGDEPWPTPAQRSTKDRPPRPCVRARLPACRSSSSLAAPEGRPGARLGTQGTGAGTRRRPEAAGRRIP